MECKATSLTYAKTGYFAPIVLDYLDQSPNLQTHYIHPPTLDGIRAAIVSRQSSSFPHRELLSSQLAEQYQQLPSSDKVNANIALLKEDNTFTICTAHQPAIFTGTLYFIYKILHAVKLAERCKAEFPDYNFVPVFYMGCEDADLEELGKIYLEGEKLTWDTDQRGAVGRMKTAGLEKLMLRIEGELSVLPFGPELMQLLREAYMQSANVQSATLQLIHRLFGDYGLVVLIPDNAKLKETMISVFEDDLLTQQPSQIVRSTVDRLGKYYKVQANPRDINLFYLDGDKRERIEKTTEDEWTVVGSEIKFTKVELLHLLHSQPGKFSPNVILRGLFQETILPNIAFIGGGGELAYWLEFADLFAHYKVPFPVLVLRNSFLLIEEKWQEKIDRLDIEIDAIFSDEEELLKQIVRRDSERQLSLQQEIEDAASYYEQLKNVAAVVDNTLVRHVSALQTRALRPLQELEKKMIRAEKRKFEAEQRQIALVKNKLFPNQGLQERMDNFMPYYAKWGNDFIRMIYEYSNTLEQEFVVLSVSGNGS